MKLKRYIEFINENDDHLKKSADSIFKYNIGEDHIKLIYDYFKNSNDYEVTKYYEHNGGDWFWIKYETPYTSLDRFKVSGPGNLRGKGYWISDAYFKVNRQNNILDMERASIDSIIEYMNDRLNSTDNLDYFTWENHNPVKFDYRTNSNIYGKIYYHDSWMDISWNMQGIAEEGLGNNYDINVNKAWLDINKIPTR